MTDNHVSARMGAQLSKIKTAEYFRERAQHGDLYAALALLNRKGGEAPQHGDEIL